MTARPEAEKFEHETRRATESATTRRPTGFPGRRRSPKEQEQQRAEADDKRQMVDAAELAG